MRWFGLALLLTFPAPAPRATVLAAPNAVAAIGSRVEMFVDDWLIEKSNGVSLKLAPPVRREVVLVTDQPWEGRTCAYFSVVQDGATVRLYYRGSNGGSDHSEDQVTCLAESADGIHFTRPKLGLFEVNGSKENNIVWRGSESHNFAPFLDANPKCSPAERYKALGGVKQSGKNWAEGTTPGGLFAFASPDGIHWRKLRPDPVITKGTFDSLNVAFWDPASQRYRCYSRVFVNGVRAIQSSESPDFLAWTAGVDNRYAEGAPREHFYTSAACPCPGAEHILLAFPKRFVPGRTKLAGYKITGVSDAVFMSSRDGLNWDRTFLEAWVRPGLDTRNWTQRSNMPAWGIVQLDPAEFSLYISEHYMWPDNRLRRLSVRKYGFASIHAGAAGGEFTTRPLTFAGKQLLLNYSTSAAGCIQVELLDESGQPIQGRALADMPPLFGDELEGVVTWKSGGDLSALAGKPVRLRFLLKDADLFSLRFADKTGQ